MAARKQQSNGYQAWTYALAGLLALTNAGWFLSSRITAQDHAAALQAAQVPSPVQERIVYEYRDRPVEQQQPRRGMQRLLKPNEQCRPSGSGGVVFAKIGNKWSSSGEPCDPTLV